MAAPRGRRYAPSGASSAGGTSTTHQGGNPDDVPSSGGGSTSGVSGAADRIAADVVRLTSVGGPHPPEAKRSMGGDHPTPAPSNPGAGPSPPLGFQPLPGFQPPRRTPAGPGAPVPAPVSDVPRGCARFPPGTSAIFALAAGAHPDDVFDDLSGGFTFTISELRDFRLLSREAWEAFVRQQRALEAVTLRARHLPRDPEPARLRRVRHREAAIQDLSGRDADGAAHSVASAVRGALAGIPLPHWAGPNRTFADPPEGSSSVVHASEGRPPSSATAGCARPDGPLPSQGLGPGAHPGGSADQRGVLADSAQERTWFISLYRIPGRGDTSKPSRLSHGVVLPSELGQGDPADLDGPPGGLSSTVGDDYRSITGCPEAPTDPPDEVPVWAADRSAPQYAPPPIAPILPAYHVRFAPFALAPASVPRSFAASFHDCDLPLKEIYANAVDIDDITRSFHGRRGHWLELRRARAVLRGTHPVWKDVKRLVGKTVAPAASHVSHVGEANLARLLEWGVLLPLPRDQVGKVPPLRLFLVPKSDGTTSRPILDARPINDRLVDRHRTKLVPSLLRLLDMIRVGVGTAHPYTKSFCLAELDAQSFFPSLKWGVALQRLHTVRIGDRTYMHVAPAQGSAVLPYVAQTIMSALAGAPEPGSPHFKWVDQGIAITYDNVLLSGPREDLLARHSQVRSSLERHRVKIGSDTGLQCTLTSCGVCFYVNPTQTPDAPFPCRVLTPTNTSLLGRYWSVKPSWAIKAYQVIHDALGRWGDLSHLDLQRLAGYALWAVRVRCEPLVRIGTLLYLLSATDKSFGPLPVAPAKGMPSRALRETLHACRETLFNGVHSPDSFDSILKGERYIEAAQDELRSLADDLHASPWRALISYAPIHQTQPIVIFHDAAATKAGYVVVDTAPGPVDSPPTFCARTWEEMGLFEGSAPTNQQEYEMAGAANISEFFELYPHRDFIAVTDNLGVYFHLVSGNPPPGQAFFFRKLWAAVQSHGVRLGVAWMEGASHPADWLSRDHERPEDVTTESLDLMCKSALKSYFECEWSFARSVDVDVAQDAFVPDPQAVAWRGLVTRSKWEDARKSPTYEGLDLPAVGSFDPWPTPTAAAPAAAAAAAAPEPPQSVASRSSTSDTVDSMGGWG